jgi:hypothetical protein
VSEYTDEAKADDRLIARLEADLTFRQALLDDPRTTLTEAGLPADTVDALESALAGAAEVERFSLNFCSGFDLQTTGHLQTMAAVSGACHQATDGLPDPAPELAVGGSPQGPAEPRRPRRPRAAPAGNRTRTPLRAHGPNHPWPMTSGDVD